MAPKSMMNMILVVLFVAGYVINVNSHSIVDTLPGYPGPLPFKLQTGYIGLGENDELQLFYYFIESQSQPNKDPLLLWLSGGPGCSGFFALSYEIGPLAFETQDYNGSFPSLTINPYSWTKIANIIFIDSPVGTGFSYSTTSQGYEDSNDTKSSKFCHLFLKKWLSIYSMFSKNRLYIAGDSHGGKIVPMLALEIALGNEDGVEPHMFLQGYIVGNSITDKIKDENQIVPYQHRMALISDEYFELAKNSCDGEYINPDPNNILCLYALQFIKQCTHNLNAAHVLEPKCKFMSPHLPEHDPVGLLFRSKEEESWCRNYNYVNSYVWANNETVREALHIRKGTKGDWKRCNTSLSYELDVESVFEHHKLLNEKGIEALVYSGDHDMIIPYMRTLQWIRQLNLTLNDNWRAWSVDGQVAGYTERYKNNQVYLVFATVKGAGHTAPEYKPKECFQMIKRWLSLYPL